MVVLFTALNALLKKTPGVYSIMHETIIAKKVIADAQKLAGKGRKIKSVTLEVGELAHLPAGELKAALATLTAWKIKVVGVKARAECECGFTGHPRVLMRGHDFCLYECPKCGRAPALSEGGEIILKEVRF